MGKRCNCGALNDDKGIYCKACGADLKEITRETNYTYTECTNQDITIGTWIGITIIEIIPVINIIAAIYYLIKGDNKSLKNYIIAVIIYITVIVFFAFLVAPK